MAKTIHRAEYRALMDLLRERRQARGLSQTAIAQALGWSQQKYSAAESGARRLDVLEFIELAGALGLRPARALEIAKRQQSGATRKKDR